jgi:hypothetical protein
MELEAFGGCSLSHSKCDNELLISGIPSFTVPADSDTIMGCAYKDMTLPSTVLTCIGLAWHFSDCSHMIILFVRCNRERHN